MPQAIDFTNLKGTLLDLNLTTPQSDGSVFLAGDEDIQQVAALGKTQQINHCWKGLILDLVLHSRPVNLLSMYKEYAAEKSYKLGNASMDEIQKWADKLPLDEFKKFRRVIKKTRIFDKHYDNYFAPLEDILSEIANGSRTAKSLTSEPVVIDFGSDKEKLGSITRQIEFPSYAECLQFIIFFHNQLLKSANINLPDNPFPIVIDMEDYEFFDNVRKEFTEQKASLGDDYVKSGEIIPCIKADIESRRVKLAKKRAVHANPPVLAKLKPAAVTSTNPVINENSFVITKLPKREKLQKPHNLAELVIAEFERRFQTATGELGRRNSPDRNGNRFPNLRKTLESGKSISASVFSNFEGSFEAAVNFLDSIRALSDLDSLPKILALADILEAELHDLFDEKAKLGFVKLGYLATGLKRLQLAGFNPTDGEVSELLHKFKLDEISKHRPHTTDDHLRTKLDIIARLHIRETRTEFLIPAANRDGESLANLDSALTIAARAKTSTSRIEALNAISRFYIERRYSNNSRLACSSRG